MNYMFIKVITALLVTFAIMPAAHTQANETEVMPEEPETSESYSVTIEAARNLEIGDTVTVEGVITAKLKNTVHIQDETGGIAIFPTSSINGNVGDLIEVTGTLNEYNGLLQLQDVSVNDTIGQKEIKPEIVLGSEIGEGLESELVRINDIEVKSIAAEGSGWTNYLVGINGFDFILRDEDNTLNLNIGTVYESVTGIIQEYDNTYQILPRSASDIIADSSSAGAPTASITPGHVAAGTEVELASGTEDASIYYTLDGSTPTTESNLYEGPITITEDTTISAIAVSEGLTDSPVSTFEYTTYDSETGIAIHDIQGTGHYSPLDGSNVENVEGIVTYIYEIRGGQYFHMQTPEDQADDDPNTSEGIIVYTGNTLPDVQKGDLVNVTGQVSEYHIEGFSDKEETDLPVTQINARDDRGGSVEVTEENVPMPEPYTIESMPSETASPNGFSDFNRNQYAIDFWESLEGMSVKVNDVRTVAPQEHGDIITVLDSIPADTENGGVKLQQDDLNPERIQFKLYDNSQARDYNVVTGDLFNGPLVGYVNYGFQNYKVNIDLETMQAAHVPGGTTPDVTSIEPAEDQLTIASYNLENFSNNESTTSDDKAAKIAMAIASDMKSPDIVGVTEVQDNDGPGPGGPESGASYDRLIAAIEAAGGPRYEYANIDPVFNEDGGQPDANIRVGFLYNPERVTFNQEIPQGDAETPVEYTDGNLTLNPGRIDPNHPAFISSRKPLAAQFDFKGEQVIAIVNHWNSKGGDDAIFGSKQPIEYGSEIQRTEIAKVVSGFINEIKQDNPDANIVSVGDFNDFEWTTPLEIHEGEYMTNMVKSVPFESRYSYIYQGNSQTLDHILVSNNLKEHTVLDMIHINADFTDMSGRASDHDPLLAQIDLLNTEEDSQNPDKNTGPPEHSEQKGKPEHAGKQGPPDHSNGKGNK